jgi:hypothetical protein
VSEYEDLVEGYEGLAEPLADPTADPGPLTDEEHQAMEEMAPPLISHGMAVADQATADALDEILGPERLPSEIVTAPYSLPEEEQHQQAVERHLGVPVVIDEDMPEDVIALTELRALKPDQIPVVGKHYVIFGGKPQPVVRGNYAISEDEHVRTNLDPADTLKDHDGQRQVRADRTIRLRYRGYLCGEMTSL